MLRADDIQGLQAPISALPSQEMAHPPSASPSQWTSKVPVTIHEPLVPILKTHILQSLKGKGSSNEDHSANIHCRYGHISVSTLIIWWA